MSLEILENFRREYELDHVADLLQKKGTSVIDLFSKEITNITNENIDVPVDPGKLCDMRIIQIYDADHQEPNSIKEFFREERQYLTKIPNLKRAMYIFVSPQSVIPKHCDDDDHCFRIIQGIHVPSDVGLVIEEHELNFGFKEMVGVSSDAVHWGWNLTDEYWTVLTLCVEDDHLDEIRKIY